jgi:hypothetical protein
MLLGTPFYYGLIQHGENTLTFDKNPANSCRLAYAEKTRVDQLLQGTQTYAERFSGFFPTIYCVGINAPLLSFAISHGALLQSVNSLSQVSF